MSADTIVLDIGTARTRAGDAVVGYGLCGSVAYYVVTEHYLQVDWRTDLPIPVGWWVVGTIAGVLGGPLLLFGLGRRSGRLVTLAWPRLLAAWTLPLLAAYAVWLLATVAVLRRFNMDFATLPLHDPAALLGQPDLSWPLVLVLLPVLAKLTARVPAPAVVVGSAALSVVTPSAALLTFAIAGLRLTDAPGRRATGRDLATRAAVALIGACVLAVPQVPEGPAVVVAGLAALPLGLALASRSRSRVVAFAGTAAVPPLVAVLPVTAVADLLLVPALSGLSGTAQLAAAATEPLVLTAVAVVGAALLTVIFRRKRQPVEEFRP